MTTSFFLIFSEHPWTNFAQIFHIFSSSRIIMCTVPTRTSNCALIVSIDTRWSLSTKFFIWPINCGILTSLLLPHLFIPHRLRALLESLMPLKNWCSIHTRWLKSSLKHSICFSGIFFKFKTEFYCILFFWSVLTSRLHFWNSPAVTIRR